MFYYMYDLWQVIAAQPRVKLISLRSEDTRRDLLRLVMVGKGFKPNRTVPDQSIGRQT